MPRPAAKPVPLRTYREAYAALARIAGELESGEADLDRVLPLLQEAQAAYAVCRERIEALRGALGPDAGTEDTTDDAKGEGEDGLDTEDGEVDDDLD